MDYQAIIAGTVGKDNTYGTVVGGLCRTHLLIAGFQPMISTEEITSYLGEGELIRTIH